MSDLIDLLEKRQLIWHGHGPSYGKGHRSSADVLGSGYEMLDEKLEGGLPKSGVINIHSPVGIGELRVLMAMLSVQSRLLVFINPPGLLCAEFFYHQGFDLSKVLVIYPRQKNEALWAAEQCLKSGACSAVLLWQNTFEIHQVKRLQIACNEGNCLQFLMRANVRAMGSLPVSLSMSFQAHEQGLEVSILKRKGGWPIPAFTLDMSACWPSFSLAHSLNSNPKNDNIIPFPSSHHRQTV